MDHESLTSRRSLIPQMFGLDLRSLALFRIGLGGLMLWDLVSRSRHLADHYSDVGLLPRQLVGRIDAVVGATSFRCLDFHAIGGSTGFITILFVVHAIAAFAMLVGFRTRVSSIITWLMLVSLHNRNNLVLNGGDHVFRMLMFWSMWLPLGARFSIDSLFRQKPNTNSWYATPVIGLYLTVALPYLVPWILRDEIWWSGQAVYYALSQEAYAGTWAASLLPYRRLLTCLTYATIVIEIVCPLLIINPRRPKLRMAAALSMVGFHVLGLNLFMRLGLFPFFSACGWLAFLPGFFWESCWEKMPSPLTTSTSIEDRLRQLFRWAYHDKTDRSLSLSVWQSNLATFLAVYSLAWSLSVVEGLPKPFRIPADVLRLDHRWIMYSPRPPMADGWFVVAAQLESGRAIDLQRAGADVVWEKPNDVGATFRSQRWRRLMIHMLDDRFSFLRDHYANRLVNNWRERATTDNIESVEIFFLKSRHAGYVRDHVSKKQLFTKVQDEA